MAKTQHLPIIYQPTKKTHEQTGTDDFIDPIAISISDVGGNRLRRQPDGLYVGAYLNRAIWYVAAAGTDVPTSGDKATPYKTLEYCLNQIAVNLNGQQNRFENIIALKAGETFTQVSRFYLYGGRITLTFYGDPKYGDFNSLPVNGLALPYLMADLQRPVVNVGEEPGTVGGTGGYNMIGNVAVFVPVEPATVSLLGVQINLKSGTHGTGAVDFISTQNGAEGHLHLMGSIINITDVNAVYGLLGLEASSECKVYQFDSQLRVLNTQVVTGAPQANLVARKWFFKFYRDFRGNDQSGLNFEGNTDTPGSALMKLSWSDCAALPVQAGTFNLETYPILNDPAVGLTNYFSNLYRDQQQRPVNVWSSRPFSFILSTLGASLVYLNDYLNLIA